MSILLRRIVLLLCAFWCVTPSAHAEDWKLISSAQGIEVYRKEVPGSPIVAFKGTGTIDAPLWKVASVLLDTRRAPEWVDSLKESRVVRRLGLNSYIEYNHIGMPFIIKDRDFVSEVRIEVDADAKTFALVYKPTDDPTAPVTHDVRGEILSGSFRVTSLEKERRTELTAELQCDPKGAIPSWLSNLFQKNWPRNTFEGIRAQTTKQDIVMPDLFKDVLAQTHAF